MSRLEVINTGKWIQENQNSFAPPVCNKLMHNSQLVIMFVGGPNVRADYHIEEGEELFYQIKGDMCVKILENNVHKDVVIKEGEFFLLPARIPHSPQRSANSCGLVIERRRTADETDCVRWFVPESSNVLYEKWFHCKDLGIELIPLIKNYFASEEYKTKQPGSNVLDLSKMPFSLNPSLVSKEEHGAYELIKKIKQDTSDSMQLHLPGMQFEVVVLKTKGTHVFDTIEGLDTWLWQLQGNSVVCIDSNESYELVEHDSVLLPENRCKKIVIELLGDSDMIMKITQNPSLKE